MATWKLSLELYPNIAVVNFSKFEKFTSFNCVCTSHCIHAATTDWRPAHRAASEHICQYSSPGLSVRCPLNGTWADALLGGENTLCHIIYSQYHLQSFPICSLAFLSMPNQPCDSPTSFVRFFDGLPFASSTLSGCQTAIKRRWKRVFLVHLSPVSALCLCGVHTDCAMQSLKCISGDHIAGESINVKRWPVRFRWPKKNCIHRLRGKKKPTNDAEHTKKYVKMFKSLCWWA